MDYDTGFRFYIMCELCIDKNIFWKMNNRQTDDDNNKDVSGRGYDNWGPHQTLNNNFSGG